MRVFFGLGSAELAESGGSHDLAEIVGQGGGAEDDVGTIIGVSGVVFSECVVAGLGGDFAVETGEVRFQESLTELAGAVSAEVKPQDDIAIADSLLVGVAKNHGLHEFVSARISRIGGLNGSAGEIGADFTTAEHDGIPSELVTLPTGIAIHGVVATDHGGDFGSAKGEVFFQLGHVGGTASGGGVAAVGDGVDHEVFDSGSFGCIAECGEVILMGMHAAIADEAEEMQTLAFGFFKGIDEDRHLR